MTTSDTSRAPLRHWLILVAILLVAVLLRGLYLHEISGTTEFSHPTADAAFHDYWARALVTGDWTPPANNANPYIDSVPFVRPPGYPYFLALAYALTGKSYLGARIVQMLLGVLNCWLAYLLGRAVFNRTVGLITAALMATYWALIYFETELHAPVLMVTVSLVFFLLMAAWLRRPAWWRLLLAGLVLGAMALVRPNVLLFAPAAAAWVWWYARRDTSRLAALRPVVVLTVGTLLAIAPATIRNWRVADDLVLISANGAINLYIGNNPSADGVTTRIPDVQEMTGQTGWSCFDYDRIVQGVSEKEGKSLKYSQVERYYWNRGLDYIVHHFGHFLQLTARRAALFWGPAEVSNNRAIAFEKANSPVLCHLPTFPLALALALLGVGVLVIERRRAPIGAPVVGAAVPDAPADRTGPLAILVALYVAATFLSFLPFLVAGRFRVPLLPFLFLFGAYALYRAGCTVGARAWSGALKLAVAAAALVLLTSHPLASYRADAAWWYTDRAVALANAGDNQGAVREYQLALQQNPGYIDAHMGLANLLANMGRYDEAISHFRSVAQHRPDNLEARIGLAAALSFKGHADEAAKDLRAVLARSPNIPQAHFELGRALGQLGQLDEAEKELRESLQLQPGVAIAHVSLGAVLAKAGHPHQAIDEFQQALLIDPRSTDAYREMALSFCAVDSLDAGRQAAEHALQLSPQNPTPAMAMASYFFKAGRMPEAAAWYKRAVDIDPRDPSLRINYGAALGNLGKLNEAEAEFAEAVRLAPNVQAYRQRLEQVRGMRRGQGSKP